MTPSTKTPPSQSNHAQRPNRFGDDTRRRRPGDHHRRHLFVIRGDMIGPIKKTFHWMAAHAVMEEADRLGLPNECDYGKENRVGDASDNDRYVVTMAEDDWTKVELALPHIFRPNVLDLRGKFKRYGMENQSRGYDAWQDIAEDEYGDYVKLADVVEYLKGFGYNVIRTSKDHSDDWERASDGV